MMGLTPRQAELLAFVREQIAQHGVSPSYDEIKDKLGLRSRGNVVRIVDGLIERGALSRLPGKARSLVITSRSDAIMVSPAPEVRSAIEAYACEHRISVETACAEALRAYFIETAQ